MSNCPMYRAPRLRAALLLVMLLCVSALSLPAQSLQITSPADGTTVNPGQSLSVTVSASGTFQQVILIGGDPIGFSQPLSAPPYQFTLQIPTSILPGKYPLTADGATSPGQGVSSDPITLDVERSDAPLSLTIRPSLLHFSTVGQIGYLRVLGTFADGTTSDLTQAGLTSFTGDGVVASASSYGVVTAVAPGGGGFVNAAYGNLSISIPVTVDFPLNIAPYQKVLYAGQTQQFTAQPAALATPTILWSISPTGVGSISNTGLYTAPSAVTAPQTVTVTATNAGNNTQSASATVTVNLPVLINVVPSTVNLGPSQAQIFGAIVLNAPFTDVIWNLPSGSPGTLDQYGHYTAPSSISSQQTVTIQAISAMDGTTIGSGTVTLISQVATPTFSPGGGTYSTAQAVAINTSTPGASIRYTTDGSNPSETAGTLYSGPITVSTTETVKAIAYESGWSDSAVVPATYNIGDVVATPTFSPVAGTYATDQTVTIATTTAGASIRYTTDGSNPSETAGTLYSGPIAVNAATTLKAIAYLSGVPDSSIAVGVFTIPPVAMPTFSPIAGTYATVQTVTIATTMAGASIRYTTNGSNPSETAGTLYTGPIAVNATTTLNAIAYLSGVPDSAIAVGVFIITPVATPTFSPIAGTYATDQTVTIATTTAGASIRYTIDGSNPSETAGTLYSGPIAVNATTTLKAIAYTSGVPDSAIAVGVFTITPVATPTFSPVAGPYATDQTVTIATTTAGASIRYTTDGSNPSETAGNLYSGPIAVNATTTLKAIAYTSGVPDSSIAVGVFTITPVATPTFSPVAGTYATDQTVTIATTTAGASIRYTTNGSNPSETAGTLYSGPIAVNATTTLKAIAYLSGVPDSAIAVGVFIITPVATPTFSPIAGTYATDQTVTIATTTAGASIRYTTNGSNPSETAGTLYSGPIAVNATTTLKAIAYLSGVPDSSIAVGVFTITPVATPTFSPAAGTYATDQTVTIATTTAGASIRYSTNGSNPSETAGTLYSGPIAVNATTTLKAIAYLSGVPDSSIAVGLFTITP